MPSESLSSTEAEEPARQRGRSTADMIAENRGPGLFVTTLRTLVGVALVALVLFGIFLGARALEGDKPVERAPWATKGAPNVAPDPLVDQ